MRVALKTISATAAISLLVLFALAATHVQAISDWYRLQNYSLPADVASIATQDTMTLRAQHILDITHPVLENNGANFQKACPQGEQTIVLGCFRPGAALFNKDSTLFVYNVKDPRLAGVQQVTTAHEMLHAAYDRLSTSERNRVNAMLVEFYSHDLHDKRLQDTIDAYKQSEPDDVVNEMHSIFGTEVSSLPAPLEDYYRQYFVNRQAVASFAGQYQSEFTSRISQIDADDQKLGQLKKQIEVEEQQLQAQLTGLNADRARVERSDDPATINDYNSRVSTYNAGVRRLQSDIASYNDLVEERNALASELRSLQGSLDSRLTTQSAQ